ncbi:response regulator transcription factor [Leptospirillum ferriphilum]|uniref:Transcriptional regulator n=1 Tax=Leptospirillum ferriphilum YSK TaxID=1441628 RepID=A0A059Y0L0_9BACT|nr:response regulator transcription factor [Leptospirillum ferriphilum]AIA30997.1 transcriptional regulator [Leptospirillum ferriphilum YSK]
MTPTVSGQTLILILDRDPKRVNVLRHLLERERYQVVTAGDASEGLWSYRKIVLTDRPILAVVDMTLPSGAGMDVLRVIRSSPRGQEIPILAIGDPENSEIKIRTLTEGAADDFLEKPFNPREFLVRIGVLLRRYYQEEFRGLRFVFGPLTFDSDRMELRLEGKEIFLTPIEYRIVHYLILHQGFLVRKEDLSAALWSPDTMTEEDNLKVHICSIRKKLEDPARAPRFIETVRGFGYRFRKHWQEEPPLEKDSS